MQKDAYSLLKITIPARPEILLKMAAIMAKTNPNVEQVVETLKEDAGLYSIVLATVNSPHFRLRKKISSISHAIVLLGLPKVFSLVRLVLLKNTLSKYDSMERFWDTASEVALITQELTSRYTELDCDNAYSIGMLHDCGIPIIMQTDPNYKDILRQTNGESRILLETEKNTYGIEHFTLGAKLVKKWQMPESVYKTIILQASFPDILLKYKSRANDSLMYLSLLSIAKDISSNYRRFWRLNNPQEITPSIMACLEYIGLCDYDYLDLKEEYIDTLEQAKSS
ncbi:MAG: HDOD domain-containing protein [Pseudomonadales bacterium]|jgi:HD-like signal output (HDOD) protein